MKGLALLLLFAVAVIVALKLMAARGGKKPREEEKDAKPEESDWQEKAEKWPYVQKKSVLTEVEQVLYWRLFEAMPGMVVLAQVGMSRVLEVPKKTPKQMSWFGKIAQKSLDYVICRKDGSTVVAIELDDSSHKDREKADKDKERALNEAGIQLIRWNVKALPTAQEIKRQIAPILMAKQQNGS